MGYVFAVDTDLCIYFGTASYLCIVSEVIKSETMGVTIYCLRAIVYTDEIFLASQSLIV